MTERTGASWLVYTLGALCAGAIAVAVLVVGPASGSQATVTRTATVAPGVVQSTVSGSGNLQAASQLNLGFKTSGTVTHIYVAQGEQVAQGQLLATLDPQSAEVALEQARATLQSAEANLAKEEETGGETSTAGSSNGSSAGGASNAAAASLSSAGGSEIAYAATATSPGNPPATTVAPTSTGAPTATSPSSSAAPTSTTPATTAPTKTSPSKGTAPTTTTPSKGAAPTSTTPSKGTATAPERESKESSSSSSKSTISTATREANLASARAAVKSDKLSVQGAEQAVVDTRLYAPESGTIASLSGQVGEVVSGSGTTRASSTSSSSSGSGSSAAGAGSASSSGRSGAGSSSSSGSSGSSGSAGSSGSSFAVLSDLSSMQLVVPLSESEISHVRDGQIATVTVEALEGRKQAAHVSEVAILSTSNSGVVSYDVTFQLDQMESGLKPGMSATAEVVVKQAEGINVPTSAISADTVTVVRNGKHVRQSVVTGLAGNSSTIILSGLQAGETVVLPTATNTGASLTSKLGGRLGGGLGGGGLGGGGLGGGAALFRGGG